MIRFSRTSRPTKQNETEDVSSGFRFSIGTNIVLMGIVAVLLWRNPPVTPSPVAPSVLPAAARSETLKTDAVTKELQPKSAGPELTPPAFAQLERMGISRDTLVNVLLEDLNRRSGQRILELQKKYAPKRMPDREFRKLSRQSDAERICELKKALGEEGYLAWDKEQTLRELNSLNSAGLFMTAEEAEQAYRLQKEFEEENRELELAMEDGIADKADAGTLQAQTQQTLDRELGQLLGQQRFDEIRGITNRSRR